MELRLRIQRGQIPRIIRKKRCFRENKTFRGEGVTIYNLRIWGLMKGGVISQNPEFTQPLGHAVDNGVP